MKSVILRAHFAAARAFVSCSYFQHQQNQKIASEHSETASFPAEGQPSWLRTQCVRCYVKQTLLLCMFSVLSVWLVSAKGASDFL